MRFLFKSTTLVVGGRPCERVAMGAVLVRAVQCRLATQGHALRQGGSEMHGAGIYTYTLTTAHRRELRASFGFIAVAAAGRPACRVALRAGAALHLTYRAASELASSLATPAALPARLLPTQGNFLSASSLASVVC